MRTLPLLLLLATAAFGQTTTGSIEGHIQDQTGARIPGVEIAAFNEATGAKWAVAADPSGAFRLQGLPPGVYRVEISCPGFARRALAFSVLTALMFPPTVRARCGAGQAGLAPPTDPTSPARRRAPAVAHRGALTSRRQ